MKVNRDEYEAVTMPEGTEAICGYCAFYDATQDIACRSRGEVIDNASEFSCASVYKDGEWLPVYFVKKQGKS